MLLVGLSHGFIVAGLLLFRTHRSPSKVLLALSLLVFNLLCLKILIHTTGLWQTHVFRYFPIAVELAIQPLIWLYVRSLTQKDFTFRKHQLLHFIPFAISQLYSIFIYAHSWNGTGLAGRDDIVNRFYFNTIKEIEDYLSVISGFVYWFLGLKTLVRFRAWIVGAISNTDFPSYTWLKNIALLMGLLIVLLFIDVTLDYFFLIGKQVFIHWQVFFIYVACLIYYLGFRGYLLPDNPLQLPPRWAENGFSSYQVDEPASIGQPKFSLPPEKLLEMKGMVAQAFESMHVYLDADLSIQKLANILQVSPALVSAVINQAFGRSFRSLVNDYRLEHVKRKLIDPASAHLSIAGIAYESGFNSEASFYRIFKSAEGVSPKEYIRQCLAKKMEG